MKSVSKKSREKLFKYAADQVARMPMIQDRCHKHPERYASTSIEVGPVCWECYLGPAVFRERFKEQAETFYQPGGPGYAGE